MKQLLLPVAVLFACMALLFGGVYQAVSATMPPYRDSLGDDNYTEKITGLYLVRESAAREDNLIIYGSSELRTLEIPTHPANFFSDKRSGFQVNLVGRGSCQSIIHALSIAASGDALAGKKVVLVTSPQSYVEEGIAPDLFMANFSPQQYLELIASQDISDDVKVYISARVAELMGSYGEMEDAVKPDTAIRLLAAHTARPTALTTAGNAALSPYYAFSRYLLDLDDLVSSRKLLETVEGNSPAAQPTAIDWQAEEEAAISAAREMTGNNGYGMLNDYYTTYIGTRLARQEGKDAALDYSVSREYDDLRVLFEVCNQKGIEPLFVHVPLHGQWSDYTGFPAARRQQYYQNVRDIAGEYGIEVLDLTGYEYEEYFLCDVMHLGWKGWLEVDQAIVSYYFGD